MSANDVVSAEAQRAKRLVAIDFEHKIKEIAELNDGSSQALC
jgi:hypothetical protein